jgi:hypothetical protein
MENPNITRLEKPVLDKPYMIEAFSSWVNAYEVPSRVLSKPVFKITPLDLCGLNGSSSTLLGTATKNRLLKILSIKGDCFE